MGAEDTYEREVRKRYANFLSEAGVDEGRIALEVLFMLPPEFVRMYRELFDMALKWEGNNGGSGSGGPQDEGQLKKRGEIGDRDPMNSRTIRGAVNSGGKKWRKQGFALKSEAAAEEKRKLDRRIVDGVGTAIRAARAKKTDVTDEIRDKKGKGDRCPQCGRGGGKSWIFCPFDGTPFNGTRFKQAE